MADLASLPLFAGAHASSARTPGCRVAEIPLAKLRLQAVPGTTGVLCLPGIDLPQQPNTITGIEPQVFWLAPGDWLLCSARSPEALCADLAGSVDLAGCVATDVSAALIALEVSGPRALAALQSGCGLDLEGGALRGARCAHTLLAQVTVLRAEIDSGGVWRIFCERPVARWLRDWLLNAAGDQRNMDT